MLKKHTFSAEEINISNKVNLTYCLSLYASLESNKILLEVVDPLAFRFFIYVLKL